MSRAPWKLVACLSVAALSVGCQQLEGRNTVRKGNRDFRETKFIDAVAEYEQALKTVKDPIIHYNAGLAYSKIAKAGADEGTMILLGEKGTFVCDSIPKVTYVTKQVCVKPGDRRFDECDAQHVCASSFTCKSTELCLIDNMVVGDMSGNQLGVWLQAHPGDAETRGIMTQVWLDSSQYKVAIDYWTNLLAQKPNDPDIMGSLAGINLKAGDWRKSIEWYTKVAESVKDEGAKVGAYQFIGNVAWAKLNSKQLTNAESVELADRGIGALQKAAEIQPKNTKLVSLQASIFNFRSLAQGVSWAAGLDRASAQDLQHRSRVLRNEAKKAQGLPTTPAPAPATTNPAPGESAGGESPKTGG
jgi:tetratricopeptide (TPR) repeat protein